MRRLHRRHRDQLQLRDNVRIDIWDAASGALLATERGHNLVVQSGLNLVRDRLNPDGTAGPVTQFGLGTDGSAAAMWQTALGAEIAPKRPVSRVVTDTGEITFQLHITSTEFNGNTIREAGLFTAADVLVARYVLSSAIVKSNAIAVTFTWTLDLGAV